MLNLTPLPLRGGKRDNFDKRVRQVGEPRQQFCVGSRDLVILLRIQAKAKAMPVKLTGDKAHWWDWTRGLSRWKVVVSTLISWGFRQGFRKDRIEKPEAILDSGRGAN